MSANIVWLFAFVGIYWAYCLYWGVRGAQRSRTSADYFVAGRSIGMWVFVLAATATSFSGWTFIGHPGKIFTDGLPYAFASFYALTIPFTGVLFLRRQWVLGRAFSYITPGEMYSDYYGGGAIRLLTVLVAFLFSAPYLGVQLRASGDLFEVLTNGKISVEVGMFALSAVVVLYVAAGGLRSVAYVDCMQCVLLALGIVILGVIAIRFVGGWPGFTDGLADHVRGHLDAAQRLAASTDPDDAEKLRKLVTPDGYSSHVALPGVIQTVKSGGDAVGGVWTGMMCMTYMFALMGIQASPAFSMWAFSNRSSRPFRWQQVVASSIVIGIILFTFTIFQGFGGHILIADGTLESSSHTKLVPQLIHLLSDGAPWLVGLLAVCALAAMQSTGAAYMSTFSGMVTRDLYRHFLSRDASDAAQKFCGRFFVVLVTVAALVVAATNTQAIVMLGGLAVAYGFQMYPALMGLCYFPRLSRSGVVAGLVCGLIAVTLTDKTTSWFASLGLPWGAYPLTIHSAGWGILCNVGAAVIFSLVLPDRADRQEHKLRRHRFIQDVSGIDPSRRWAVPVAWVLTVIWFLVGFGPFAVVGNTLFSDPNTPAEWGPFGLPSLWIWQLCMLVFGIFVMWFLAFHVGLSKPIPPERVEQVHRAHFPDETDPIP
ncbi:MAG: sodium:solute symporter [Phycisphaeraceae bacterium]|nr:sodium:solute symporter [Phycisphaeraceae bacterium]